MSNQTFLEFVGAKDRVPNGYWKHITFPNGRKECFYFPNSTPTKHWSDYEIQCQVRREKTLF